MDDTPINPPPPPHSPPHPTVYFRVEGFADDDHLTFVRAGDWLVLISAMLNTTIWEVGVGKSDGCRETRAASHGKIRAGTLIALFLLGLFLSSPHHQVRMPGLVDEMLVAGDRLVVATNSSAGDHQAGALRGVGGCVW